MNSKTRCRIRRIKNIREYSTTKICRELKYSVVYPRDKSKNKLTKKELIDCRMVKLKVQFLCFQFKLKENPDRMGDAIVKLRRYILETNRTHYIDRIILGL